MSWFKRSSQSNGAGRSEIVGVAAKQRKSVKNKSSKRTKRNDDEHDHADDDLNCQKRLSYLSTESIEIVDPELFFHDPEHVRNYREEAQFLQLMSEWEIIENPATNLSSFFSADFEEEFLQMRTQTNEQDLGRRDREQEMDIGFLNNNNNNEFEQDLMGSNEMVFDIERKWQKSQEKKKISELFFADQIQMGIALPKINSCVPNGMVCKRRKPRKRKAKYSNENLSASSDGETWCHETYVQILPSTESCSRSVTKNCDLDREQLKTEALACSIMGAIGKCPNKDSSTTLCSSESDLLTNKIIDRCHPTRYKPRCDHYDIKEFFRLDDYGNILLNINHITEFKGHGFKAQCKRTYRRYRKECQCTDDVMLCQERGCCFALRRLFYILWQATIGECPEAFVIDARIK